MASVPKFTLVGSERKRNMDRVLDGTLSVIREVSTGKPKMVQYSQPTPSQINRQDAAQIKEQTRPTTPTQINRQDAAQIKEQTRPTTPTQINRQDSAKTETKTGQKWNEVKLEKSAAVDSMASGALKPLAEASRALGGWIKQLETEARPYDEVIRKKRDAAKNPSTIRPDTELAYIPQGMDPYAPIPEVRVDAYEKEYGKLQGQIAALNTRRDQVNYLEQEELARTAPKAFQRNLAAQRQSLARTQADGEATKKDENDIRKKIKQAEDIQRAVSYEAYSQRGDFEELGKPGMQRGVYQGYHDLPKISDLAYDFINDLGKVRDMYGRVNEDGKYQVTVTAQEFHGNLLKAYSFLTPEEVKTFNAIDKLEGTDAAMKYLDFMTEELNRRQGIADYEAMPQLGKALYWVPAGLDQFANGVNQLFSKEALPTSPVQFTSSLVRDEAFGTSPVLGWAYDAGTTVTNMAPSVLVSTAVGTISPGAGTVVGNTLMGASAAGNAYNQKVKEGYSPDQARTYATLIGVSEATLQYVLGGIGTLGGLDQSRLLEKIAKIDNGIARFSLTMGVRGLPEAAEEGLQAVLEPEFAAIIFGDDYEVDPEEVIYNALMGYVMGDVFAVPEAYHAAANGVQWGPGDYRLNKPYNVEMPAVPIIGLSTKDIPTQGGELPSVGNSLRSDAIARARARLGLDQNSAAYIPASNVMRDGNEYVLKITKASLKKMLSPATQTPISLESIVVMDNLERIANNGVWFDTQGDRKSRQQIAGFDHLKTTVYIDGAPYLVNMRVKLVETAPGQGTDNVLYYFTPEEILTIERVGTTPPTDERRALIVDSETMPTLKSSILQTQPEVKGEGGTSAAGIDTTMQSAFQTITSAVRLAGRTDQAKAALEQDVATLKRDFETIAKAKLNGEITPTDTIELMKLRSATLRVTIESTRYIGQGKKVDDALALLDQLDDFLAEATKYNNAKTMSDGGVDLDSSTTAAEEFTGDPRSGIIQAEKEPGTIEMPNYKQAITPAEKFIKYSLDYENPKALGKPESYERGLGYTKENAEGLIEQIHIAVTSGRVLAFDTQVTPYGIKYRYRIAVTGPNGKTKNVIAVYQVDHGSNIPRMVTNYLEGK